MDHSDCQLKHVNVFRAEYLIIIDGFKSTVYEK